MNRRSFFRFLAAMAPGIVLVAAFNRKDADEGWIATDSGFRQMGMRHIYIGQPYEVTETFEFFPDEAR